MEIDRFQPIVNPQALSQYNIVGDEYKILSADTGRTAVVRKDETSKSSSESKELELSRQEIEKLTDRINRIMGLIDKRLKFTIHEKSGKVQVKVIDQENGKVIDEIPPKRLLDLMASFRDMTGILFDHKA